MDATRYHDAWESGLLSPDFESLLRDYEQSVGGTAGGIPAERLQAAAAIPAAHAVVYQQGPGDATAGGDADEEDALGSAGPQDGDDCGCAAALDGGSAASWMDSH